MERLGECFCTFLFSGLEADLICRDGMDWRAASRSRSRAPGTMEWRPASHSRSRSRPPLSLSMGGMTGMSMGYQFPPQADSGYTNGAAAGSSSYASRPIRDPSTWIARTFDQESTDDAVRSSAIAIPGSLRAPLPEQDEDAENGGGPRGAEGLGSATGSAGVSLLTKSLQMFSESPPNAGVNFYQSQFVPPNSSALVGPHVTLSQSLKDRGVTFDPSARRPSIQQQLEEQAQGLSAAFLQQQQSHEEFVPSSLPAYRQHGQEQFTHLTGDQWQALAPTNDFPRRVRKTSFDHTVALDNGQNESRGRGRHQVNGRPMPPPTETTMVSSEPSIFIILANYCTGKETG